MIPSKKGLRIAAITLTVSIHLLSASQVKGQDGFVVENTSVQVDLGRTITFRARIKALLPIKHAFLLFRGENDQGAHMATMQVAQDGSVNYIHDASHDSYPPFSRITYWFQVVLADGKTHTSSPITFSYNDNRFPWHAIRRANVIVHWYAGDEAFGASALDSAGAAVDEMNGIVSDASGNEIHVYIYSNIEDLKNVFETGSNLNPADQVILVAIAPGSEQSTELGMEIPNEVAHVILHRALGDGYARQPAWLREGTASMVERYSNPEYAAVLHSASRNNELLSFADLCVSFPTDARNAFLAYAQSRSFVSYLRGIYGNAGLTRLLDSYRDGYNCELGATNALGIPLSQLEARWRETGLGEGSSGLAFRNLAPFLLLMALALFVPILGTINVMRIRRKRGAGSK